MLFNASMSMIAQGLFYYTLGNVEPKFRSTLHTIQLLTVVKSSLIKKYGINEILQLFMEDIKKLEHVSQPCYIKVNHGYYNYIVGIRCSF